MSLISHPCHISLVLHFFSSSDVNRDDIHVHYLGSHCAVRFLNFTSRQTYAITTVSSGHTYTSLIMQKKMKFIVHRCSWQTNVLNGTTLDMQFFKYHKSWFVIILPIFTIRMPYYLAERRKIVSVSEMCLWACIFLVSMQSLSEMPGGVAECLNNTMVPDTILISRAFLIK